MAKTAGEAAHNEAVVSARQAAFGGLTTVRSRHVKIRAGKSAFEFRSESVKDHRVGLRNPRVARVVKRMEELPGQWLFQYVDGDSQRHASTPTM